MTHKIVDDYLPDEYFKTLKDAIVLNEHFPWCRINELNVFQTTENRDVYFAHMIYQHHTPKTQEHNWNLVVPFLSQLEKTEKMHALIRVKVNYYNSTPEVVEHCKHYDYPAMPLPHKGAILYLNTNDGFTRLEDGTKIESIENRLLVFDASKMHNSTTTTSFEGRYNINVNYF